MSSPRPSKRQRIRRACDQCRRRKSKCDGDQPACRICQAAGRTCSYENGGGRRGLPTGYVRGLETALGLIFFHIPNSEKALLKLLRERSNEVARNRALDSWRRSKVASHLSHISLQESDEGFTRESITDNEWELEERSRNPSGPVDLSPTSPAKLHTPPIYHHERLGGIDVSLPRNTTDLIDTYFTHTHSWFPILERRDLLRAMYTYPQEFTTQHAPHHLVLWAVIAYTSTTGLETMSEIDPVQISLAVQQQILSNPDQFELAHIQALIILALLHLAIAKLPAAWILIGQAGRMLTLLLDSSREGRFLNTSHGCIVLDNIISALLDRAPSCSVNEQVGIGPMNEDDVEEWDTWMLSRASAPRGPLRALSTLNRMKSQTDFLSRILYHPLNIDDGNDMLFDAQQERAALLTTYPYRGCDTATPSLLTLHLISGFVILTAIRHFKLLDNSAKSLMITTSHHTLDLLDDYLAITASVKSSPLLRYFALQCQYCLDVTAPDHRGPGIKVLATRISERLQSFDSKEMLLRHPTLCQLSPRDEPPEDANINIQTEKSSSLDNAFPVTGMEELPRTSSLDTLQLPYATPISNLPTLEADAPLQAYQSLALMGDNDGLDDLFEELVTSIPTRLEPEFAQNLGFYAGGLDTDFMSQLQRLPDA
ncbi:hypothetical protein BDV12DRAFT_210660 [Aspergillus spectabilis]